MELNYWRKNERTTNLSREPSNPLEKAERVLRENIWNTGQAGQKGNNEEPAERTINRV